MLCGLLKRKNAAADCDWLEDEPGNDASPRSLKASLSKELGYKPSAEQQAELVSGDRIDPKLIDLCSFKHFSEELDRAYANAHPPQA